MSPHRTAARVGKGGTVTISGLSAPEGQEVEIIVLPKASDAERYASSPVGSGEFEEEDDPLGWDGDGWEQFE